MGSTGASLAPRHRANKGERRHVIACDRQSAQRARRCDGSRRCLDASASHCGAAPGVLVSLRSAVSGRQTKTGLATRIGSPKTSAATIIIYHLICCGWHGQTCIQAAKSDLPAGSCHNSGCSRIKRFPSSNSCSTLASCGRQTPADVGERNAHTSKASEKPTTNP
jgi:hypothetical protein